MAKAGMSDATAYKIFTADEYLALQRGTFTGAPVDLADGYIHLSTAAQLRDTIDRHFAGRDNLMIAAIDPVGARARRRLVSASVWSVAAGRRHCLCQA
jgi:uncharacterized protein (DUF952 family)